MIYPSRSIPKMIGSMTYTHKDILTGICTFLILRIVQVYTIFRTTILVKSNVDYDQKDVTMGSWSCAALLPNWDFFRISAALLPEVGFFFPPTQVSNAMAGLISSGCVPLLRELMVLMRSINAIDDPFGAGYIKAFDVENMKT
jgi:hypothetical protein